MRAPRRLTLTVAPDQAGRKVDDLLRGPLGLSGTAVKRAKRLEDGILLDGVRAITGQRTAAGQALSVRVADPDHKGVMLPTPGPLDIVYEDGDLLVLNKAPGVTVHPGPGHYADTLCNFIAYYYRERGITAVVVIHDLNLALRFADQFLVMKEGTVCAFGGREVVGPEMIWEVYGVQAQVLEVNGRPVVVPQ